MSIRIETNGDIQIHNGATRMEDVTVYATTRTDAQAVDTSHFIMGSLLYVIQDGRVYMLDDDGSAGTWRAVADGTSLAEGGDA